MSLAEIYYQGGFEKDFFDEQLEGIEYQNRHYEAVLTSIEQAIKMKSLKAQLKKLEDEEQSANLENGTESIDVPGGKDDTVYKYRGTFILPDGKPKEITGKTASEFLQKASDATVAWFEERKAIPQQQTPEPEKQGPTFREWTENLIEKHALKTLDRQQEHGYLKNWIYPSFGDKLITNIKHTDCQAFADHLSKAPTNSGKPMSQKTAKHILDLISSIMKKAMLDDIISKNPMNDIDNRCKKADDKYRYLTDSEKAIYLKALLKIQEENVRLFAGISIATGLRPEETMALTWADYHTEEEIPYFTINKAVQTQNLPKDKKGAQLKDTKTEAGNRRVPIMCTQVAAMLNEARQAGGYIIKGMKSNCHGDKPISAHQKATIDDKLNVYLKAEGMELRTTGYDCRHTMATMLGNTKAAMKSIKYIMGHADTDFTVGTYIENDWAQVKKDAQKVNAFFDSLSVA